MLFKHPYLFLLFMAFFIKLVWPRIHVILERFRIAFTANGKREIRVYVFLNNKSA